jgi:hypothetical protein
VKVVADVNVGPGSTGKIAFLVVTPPDAESYRMLDVAAEKSGGSLVGYGCPPPTTTRAFVTQREGRMILYFGRMFLEWTEDGFFTEGVETVYVYVSSTHAPSDGEPLMGFSVPLVKS